MVFVGLLTQHDRYLALAAALFALIIVCPASALALDLRISLDTSEYIIHEPIWLDIYLINEGSETEEIPAPTLYGDWFNIFVVDASGDTLDDRSPRGDFISIPMASPSPGDTGFTFVNLQEEFGSPNQLGIPSLEPGIYQITAAYPGKLRSNSLQLRVIQPAGMHSGIFDHFSSLAKTRTQNKLESVRQLRDFAVDYPESPYSPVALKLAYELSRYGLFDKATARDVTMDLLRSYPNSGYSVRLFPNVQAILGRDGAKALFDSLTAATAAHRLRLAVRPMSVE